MKKCSLLLVFIIFITGCSKSVTNDYLIGGHWVETAGYINEEVTGDPLCPPFDDGIEFINEDTVFVDEYGEDFDYHLRKADEEVVIEFHDPNGVLL